MNQITHDKQSALRGDRIIDVAVFIGEGRGQMSEEGE